MTDLRGSWVVSVSGENIASMTHLRCRLSEPELWSLCVLWDSAAFRLPQKASKISERRYQEFVHKYLEEDPGSIAAVNVYRFRRY